MSKYTTKNIINFIGWLGVVLIAVCAIISKIVPNISSICRTIAMIIGFVVASLVGFYYASTKRNKIWFAVLILAVLIAVILFFI